MVTQRQKLKKQIHLLECELLKATATKDAFAQIRIYKELDKAKSTIFNLD